MKQYKRTCKKHQFDVGDRKATLSLPLNNPDKVQLTFGRHFTVQEDFSVRWCSKMQKQMRQYLFNRLAEMELPDEYYLVMDFAVKPVIGKSSFCELAVTFPNRFPDSYRMNEEFCRDLIERFNECLT